MNDDVVGRADTKTMTTDRVKNPPAIPEVDFEPFRPRMPWWGGDLQTLRNFLVRPAGPSMTDPGERLFLPMNDGSGDVLAAAIDRPAGFTADEVASRALVILVHGLTGAEESVYMRRSSRHYRTAGHAVLRLNLRGAGPSRPLCRQQYHAGRTADLRAAIAALPTALTSAGIFFVGYSLGANVVLKLLGEGAPEGLIGAVAVSAPLDLAATARRMMQPRNAVYQHYLLTRMREESVGPGSDVTDGEREALARVRSVWDFDDVFTAPRNGFRDAVDYYQQNSSGRFLAAINRPALIVHALDDPWIPPAIYDRVEWRSNPMLHALLAPRGGHVGFHARGADVPWHDRCGLTFLRQISRS